MDGAQLASRQQALLRAHVSQGGRKWDITCNFAQSKFPVMTEKRYFSIHWKEYLSSPRGSHCSAAEKLPQPQDANVKMLPGRMQTFLQTETCWWLILVGFKTVVKGVVFPPLKKNPKLLGLLPAFSTKICMKPYTTQSHKNNFSVYENHYLEWDSFLPTMRFTFILVCLVC